MKILFWNTHNNKNINHILSELIIENNINIVVVAEYEADISNLIEILSKQRINMRPYNTIGCERIKIIGDIDDVISGLQDDHYSLQIIKKEYILCCVHLTSQLYNGSEDMRNIRIRRIINDIQALEKNNNIEKTIIVGDFNIDPFEHGCINADLFHSLPYYETTVRKCRTVAGQSFQMFYNPMWNILGDFSKPYGTYYYSGSEAYETFWHIFDQVMIRPVLRESFVNSSLKIITETKSLWLINRNGHPDINISDHLPITFEIKENKYGET